VPLLNGHGRVGDGWWRMPHGGKEWEEGRGGRCGLAGTSLEPAGVGGRRTPTQNRGGRVAARWAWGTVVGRGDV
jgi:hypothetical protein